MAFVEQDLLNVRVSQGVKIWSDPKGLGSI